MREISTPDCVESKYVDRQPRDVRFHPPAHLGDRALGRHAEHLGQRKRRHRLHQRRGARRHRQRDQEVGAALADDVVNQVLGKRRQHESGETIDQHQRQADAEPAATRQDQRLGLLPRRRRHLFLLRRVLVPGTGRFGDDNVAPPLPPRAFRPGQPQPHSHWQIVNTFLVQTQLSAGSCELAFPLPPEGGSYGLGPLAADG